MRRQDLEHRDVQDREIPIGPCVHKLDKMLSRNMAAQVRAEGIDEITLMNGWVIRYLYEARDEEVFQKDIEKFFSIGRSTVTNIIQLMEKKGFVTRESVSSDARLKKVKLTKKGIDSHQAIEQIISRLDQEMVQGITEEELDTFYTVVEKIRGNLKINQETEERKEIEREEEHAECIAERS